MFQNIKSYIKNTNPRRAIDSFYYDKDKTKPVDFDDDLDVTSDLDIYIEWNNNNKIVTI